MFATGSHNGTTPQEATGYGLKFSKEDRDRYFNPEWESMVLEFDGGGTAEIPLAPSFWKSSLEVRSPAIGEWLLKSEAAPWAKQTPPGIVVTPIEGSRFSARLLKRRPFKV
jgi:hypothetical protein